MMGFNEFVTEMCSCIRDFLPEEYDGCKIIIGQHNSNHGYFPGMVLSSEKSNEKETALEPCINLTSCYICYRANGDMPALMKAIAAALNPSGRHGNVSVGAFFIKACGMTGNVG